MERIEDIDETDQLYLPHFPHDVVSQDILSRLPVKTIYRFRSVSKLWCSLPNDPAFIKMHLTRSLQASKVIIMSYRKVEGGRHNLLSFYSMDISETGIMTKLMFTVPLDVDLYSMVPSFDGLVCFNPLRSKKIYVCNPSTHELVQLPKVYPRLVVAGSKKYYECNPSMHTFLQLPKLDPRPVLAGFGFDPPTGTYKVLCAILDDNAPQHSVEWYIYTLGSGGDCWRPIDCMPIACYDIEPGENAYIHGDVHWIVQHFDTAPYILSFSLFDESFWLLPVPKSSSWRLYFEYDSPFTKIHIKVMGGFLRLIATAKDPDLDFWTIHCWILKDYKSYIWTCDICIHIRITTWNIRNNIPLVFDIRNGKVFCSSGNKLLSHDLEKDVTEEIDVIPAEDGVKSKYQANFVESMVPVNSRFWY